MLMQMSCWQMDEWNHLEERDMEGWEKPLKCWLGSYQSQEWGKDPLNWIANLRDGNDPRGRLLLEVPEGANLQRSGPGPSLKVEGPSRWLLFQSDKIPDRLIRFMVFE